MSLDDKNLPASTTDIVTVEPVSEPVVDTVNATASQAPETKTEHAQQPATGAPEHTPQHAATSADSDTNAAVTLPTAPPDVVAAADNGTAGRAHQAESQGETELPKPAAEAPVAAAPVAEMPAAENTAQDASTQHAAPTAQPPAPEEAAHQAGAPATEAADPEAAATAQATADQAELDQFIEQYSVPQQAGPAEGETFEGRVIAVTDLGVVVDVGTKFEGLVPAQEFMDAGITIPFESGQTIEVERTGERKDGYVLLSHIRVHKRRVWEVIEKAYREHSNITAKVVDRIKGGLVVDIGVRAFLPASQIDLRPTHDLESWANREVTCRVLKLNRKRGNVVVSRRAILEEEQKVVRDALLDTLVEGAVVHGKIKNITDYGVFVDLGGVDGLLHVSDLTWGRVTHPKELVKPGDEMDVQILKFDKEKMRISLGRKQLLPDPWLTVPERFPAGTRAKGKIVGLTDYGAFVQIEPGVEGLVHVSEMTWSRRMKHPSKLVKVGDDAEVTVIEVRPDLRRISLGLKQSMPDPWDGVAERYPVGAVIHGQVRNVTDFGAFVEIEDGVEGLIHVGDISWTERVKNPGEKFKKGERIEAKVLKIDAEHRRVSLGIKQLHDTVGDWFKTHHVGEVLKGKVTRLATFGAFVELAENVEGLCHVSEIQERRPKGDRDRPPQARDAAKTSPLAVGQEYDFKIIRLEAEQRKISLSFRAAIKQAEKADMDAFRSSKTSSTATIGDAILAKRKPS
jgi:small subunit ribosomal protein S1